MPSLSAVDQWKGRGKLVIALDEFQWIAEASPELASVLQECWDRHWRDSGKVVLILCGSFRDVLLAYHKPVSSGRI